MPDYSTYQRRSRSHRGDRGAGGAPQSDAVVVALAAQVVVCALLLVIALVAREADKARYDRVSAEFRLLVTEPDSAAEVLEDFAEAGDAFRGFFASVERMITSLVERFTGAPPQPEASEPEQFEDDEPVSEAAPESEASSLPDAPVYDYLGAAGEVPGMGGAFPVSVGDTDISLLAAPEGSTFAPVALAGRVVPPVTGLITSGFSYREHPVSGDDDFHTGIDIAAEEGRDILAALPGEVVEVGESDIYGNYIILQHATNLRTFYAHCSEIIARPPMAVRQGERIAKVGQTGVATGPHLHFSVIVEGQFTDPYWVLEDNVRLVE